MEEERNLRVEICPNCNYAVVERTAYCPYCGFQLTHPAWKKAAAWLLLILIAYGLIKCHVSMIAGGFNVPARPAPTSSVP